MGQALGRNPFAIIVPCHRVLSAGGKIGGFSANGGVSTKRRLLAIEGVKANGVSAKPPPIAVTSTPPTAVTSTPPSLFGFDATLALKQLSKSDPILGRLIDKVGSFEMPLNATHSLFMALAEAIVYQQLTAKAAGTIFARVCALFPDHKAGFTPAHVLSASEAVLRGAGLSRAKYLALQDLARKAEQGTIPSVAEAQRLDNEAIIERLTPVRGVGRWTVEMLLMFRLGRIDVLPLDDYGIRKGFAVAFKKRELPAKAVIEKRGKRWKPYRTIASWYLWRAAEFKA